MTAAKLTEAASPEELQYSVKVIQTFFRRLSLPPSDFFPFPEDEHVVERAKI
jgi:hypothetical protein